VLNVFGLVLSSSLVAFGFARIRFPLNYLNSTAKFTISIGLRLFQTTESNQVAQVMAMTLLALIPVLIVFTWRGRGSCAAL